jgi:cytochrome c peroxidase
MLISALFAFCGSIGQMLIARTRKWIYRAIAHVRIRRVGVCVAVVACMSTAIPILFARDSSEPFSPGTLAEVARVEADIDRIEADTLKRLTSVPDNQAQQIELLGKLMLFDKELSVNRNEACAFCHMPETGFTGPISELNRTGSYPGSVRTRFSERKPQTHTYAPLAPVLHYNQGQGDLVGGNFWDMRATGRRLGNPAAEQAEGPPTNPTEMRLPDIACSVYRASKRPYHDLFETVWGPQAFAVTWPADVEQVCNTPGPPPANDPAPVHLSAIDRGRAAATFDQMAQSIAGYEASHEVTAFSSKYDAVLAGKAQFTPEEKQGYNVFRGKGRCNECHRDGGPVEDPLFTDFTASNIGTPANPNLPYYSENLPDDRGYVANKDGSGFIDGRGRGLPLRRSSAQPAVFYRCALEVVGIAEPRQIPGSDTAQCRQAAFARLREGVRPQWLLQKPQADRPFLQHARRIAALCTA